MRAFSNKTRWWRSATFAVLGGVMITGCSIKSDVPDFKYPSRTDYTDQDWPELAKTDELLQAGDKANASGEKNRLETDRLAARAQRLRARARALQNATIN